MKSPWREVLFTVVLIAGTLFAWLPKAAANDWQEYKYTEGRFAIAMPSVPHAERGQVESPYGPKQQQSYGAFQGDNGILLMVSVSAKTAADPRTDAEILKDAVKNVPPDAVREISQSGVRGVEYGYGSGTDARLLHIFVENGWEYILQAAAPTALFPPAETGRWMASWHLLDPSEHP